MADTLSPLLPNSRSITVLPLPCRGEQTGLARRTWPTPPSGSSPDTLRLDARKQSVPRGSGSRSGGIATPGQAVEGDLPARLCERPAMLGCVAGRGGAGRRACVAAGAGPLLPGPYDRHGDEHAAETVLRGQAGRKVIWPARNVPRSRRRAERPRGTIRSLPGGPCAPRVILGKRQVGRARRSIQRVKPAECVNDAKARRSLRLDQRQRSRPPHEYGGFRRAGSRARLPEQCTPMERVALTRPTPAGRGVAVRPPRPRIGRLPRCAGLAAAMIVCLVAGAFPRAAGAEILPSLLAPPPPTPPLSIPPAGDLLPAPQLLTPPDAVCPQPSGAAADVPSSTPRPTKEVQEPLRPVYRRAGGPGKHPRPDRRPPDPVAAETAGEEDPVAGRKNRVLRSDYAQRIGRHRQGYRLHRAQPLVHGPQGPDERHRPELPRARPSRPRGSAPGGGEATTADGAPRDRVPSPSGPDQQQVPRQRGPADAAQRQAARLRPGQGRLRGPADPARHRA